MQEKTALIGTFYKKNQTATAARAKDFHMDSTGRLYYVAWPGRVNEKKVFVEKAIFERDWRAYPPETKKYGTLSPNNADRYGIAPIGRYVPLAAKRRERVQQFYRDVDGVVFFLTKKNGATVRRCIEKDVFASDWVKWPVMKLTPRTAKKFGCQYLGTFRKTGENMRPKEMYQDSGGKVFYLKRRGADEREYVGDLKVGWREVGK